MAGSTLGILIPIDLLIRNLRDIGDQIKSFAGKNLLENAFSSKKINGELDRVGKLLDLISAKSKLAFTSNSDFTSITRDIAALEIEFNKMLDSVANLRFEDIKVPAEAQGQIEALTNKINELKGSLDNIKQIEMGKLLSNADFIKDFNIANPGKGAKILEKGYDEVEKAIKVGMGRVNTALQIANTEYLNLQANFNANTLGKSSFERTGALDFLSKAFQKLPSAKELYNAELKIMSLFMNTTTDSKGESSFASFLGGLWGSRGFLQMLQNNYSFSQTEINAIAQRARETAQELNKKVSEVWLQAGLDDTLAKKLLFGDLSSNVAAATELYKLQLEAVNAAKANLEEKIKLSDAMNRLNTAFEGPSQAVALLAEALKNALKAPQAELEQLKASVLSSVTAFPALSQAFGSAAAEINTVTTRILDGREKLASLDATINKMQGVSNFINRYIGLYAIVNKVTAAIRDAFNNIRELDKVITDISVVTNMSLTDLWGKISEYTSMAQLYGVATKDVYSVSLIFYQLGLLTSLVMSLTTETLKMAKIAGIDYADAANAMTVAVRAYNIEMSNALMVTDVYSALAAKFAVSSAEIANAMEKTASSAASVGMTLLSTSAFISVMEQTTRESAQNIGSALKSIISRYGEMKASPDKLLNIDGEEVAFNKVDTALASIGISIKDASGLFRDFDDVIMELASKWNTLDNNTLRYIATIMAGNRQQSRFIALVSNYSELSRAMTVASNAENTSIVLTAKTLDSLESKTNLLKNAFSQLYLDLHIEDGMKATYDWLTRIISTIGKLGTGNGALSSLITLINSGFGAKLLINTISDIYKLKRLNVQSLIDADTSKANTKIDELIKKAQGPYETLINAKVDSTLVKELETTVDNITNKLNNINATATTSTSTLQTLIPFTPNVFQSQLLAAFTQGTINNVSGLQQFLASAGLSPDNSQYGSIAALLSSFNGTEEAAQLLTTAFANATGLIEVAANASGEKASADIEGAAASKLTATSMQDAAVSSEKLAGASNEAAPALQVVGDSAKDAASGIKSNELARAEDTTATQEETNAKRENADATIASAESERLEAQGNLNSNEAEQLEAQGDLQVKEAAHGAALALNELSNSVQELNNSTPANNTKPQLSGNTPPKGSSLKPPEEPKISGSNSWFRRDENGSLKFSSRGMTGMMIGTSLVRMLAPVITAAGAAHKDTSKDNIEASKVWTGIGNGLSGAATGASIGMLGGPIGAIVGGVLGFAILGAGAILDGFSHNLQERIAKAEAEVEEANNESMKKLAKVIDLTSSIDNIKLLQTVMYNSEEDMKAYKDAMSNMASEYPNLVSAYDTAGNAIIDILSAEAELSSARLEGAVAARNAALAEIDASNLKLQSYRELTGPGSTLDFLQQYIDITNGKANLIGTTEYGDKIYQDTNKGIWTTTAIDGELRVQLPGELTGDTKNLGTSLVSLDEWVEKNKKLLGVSSLSEITGKESYSDYDTLDLSKIVELITAKYEAESRKNSALHDTANNAIVNETFFGLTDTKTGLSLNQITLLEGGKNFQSLFNSMLIKKLPSDYTSLYDWKNAEDSDFGSVAEEVYNNFLTWYNSLSNDLKNEFANIDFTVYGREELISKFKLTDSNVKDLFITNFIEVNKSNRDRILKTIYNTDETGEHGWDLNADLEGLAQFENGQIAKDIAYKFTEDKNKPSAILSSYADYFTTLLLDINELAENGYTELAQNRLNILGKISEALAGADSSTLRDLFSTLTKVDFSDYDSIANATKALETYKTPENAALIDPILALLTAALESLLFNVTSLALGLVDSVSNAAKDINSLLSANKSGLSFDKALDAFKELNKDLSFDKAFNYDAVLGLYVYTSEGLLQAIAAKEGNLQELVNLLNTTNDLYSKLIYKIVDEESGHEITNIGANLQASDFSSKETLQSAVVSKLAPNADSKVKLIWQNLAGGYIDSLEVGVQGTYQGFEEYILQIIDSNNENAALALAILNEYKANKKNILYQSIDWSKLALGTDFSGNNRNMAVELAKEIGLYNEETGEWVNDVEATNEEILDQYLSKLYEGQDNADQLIEQAKARIKGQIESSQSELGSKAITEILADLGTKLSEETIAYINLLKGDNLLKDVKVGEDGTLTVEDITKTLDPISAAIEIYQLNIKNSIYTTLAERNKSYGEIITKTFSKANAGKNLLAAGNKLDLSTIESSLTTLGINWDEIYDATRQTWHNGFENALSTDAFGETTIKDWNAFVTALKGKGLDLTKVTTKEYLKWYRAYLDGQVNDLNDTNEKAALDALSKLTSAGPGENVNVLALRDAGIDMSVLDPDNNGLYKVIDAYSRDSAILAINTAEITNKALKDAIEAAQLKILALGNFATATSYATKGASSLSEVDSFKLLYELLVGESLSDEAFVYDTILQSFVLDTSYMLKYIEALKNRMLQMGYTEEFVNLYIKDQTDRAIQDSIALDGFLNANTSKLRNDEANKLILLIRGLSNYQEIAAQAGRSLADDIAWRQEMIGKTVVEKQQLTILHVLESGGQAAVDLFKQIKPDASSDELEAAFNSQINKLTDVLGQVGDLVAGEFVGTEGKLYEVLARAGAVDNNGVVESGFEMVKVYAEIYAEMQKTNGKTIAGLNDVYAQMWDATFADNDNIKELMSNAGGMTMDSFKNILSLYEVEIKTVMDNNTRWGIKWDSFGDIIIDDIDAFMQNLASLGKGFTLPKNSYEYQELRKSWADAIVEIRNRPFEIIDSITSEITQLSNAKDEQSFNISTLLQALGKTDGELRGILANYAVTIRNGILTIHDASDVDGIMSTLAAEANEANIILTDDLQEITDAVSNLLQEIANIISNGISGKLSNVEAGKLTDWASEHGIDVDYTRTAEGLQLTAESAAQVYEEMKKIDPLLAKSFLPAIKDTKESYSTLTGTLMEFNDYNKLIAHKQDLANFKTLEDNLNENDELEWRKSNSKVKKLYEEVQQAIQLGQGTVETLQSKRTRVISPDGGIMTYHSLSSGVKGGKEVLVTPILPDGTVMSDNWAEEYANKMSAGEIELETKLVDENGKELKYQFKDIFMGAFDDVAAADKAAEAYHEYGAAVFEAAGALTELTAKLQAMQNTLVDLLGNHMLDSDSMNFMSNKLPDYWQGPINMWENASLAMQALTEGGKKGYMGVQDFYNIVTTASSLMEAAGQKFEVAGMNASLLLQKGAENIKVVSGKALIDLSGAGITVVGGVDELKANMAEGVQEMARAQIAILDAEIAVLEILAAMEEVGDLDVDMDGISFELEDIFENGDPFGDFTSGMSDWLTSIKSVIDKTDNAKELLLNLKVNGTDMYSLLTANAAEWRAVFGSGENVQKVLKLLMNTDWDLTGDLQTLVMDFINNLDLDGFDTTFTYETPEMTIEFTPGGVKTVDWTAKDTKTVLDQIKKDFEGNEAAARKAVLDDILALSSGKSMKTLTIELAAQINGRIKTINGNTVFVDSDGHEINSTTDPKGYAQALAKFAFELNGIDPTNAKVEGEFLTTNVTVGTNTNVKVKTTIGNEKGGIVWEYESVNGIKGKGNTEAEMLDNYWKNYVNKYTGGEQNATKAMLSNEAEKQHVLYLEFGLRAAIKASITGKDGKVLDPSTDPGLRQQMRDIANTISGEDALKLIEDGIVKNLGNGNLEVPIGKDGIKITVPGEAIDLDAKGNYDTAKLVEYLKTASGLDTAVAETITAAITEAIPSLTQALSTLDAQPAQDVATALQSIIDNATKALEAVTLLAAALANLGPANISVNAGEQTPEWNGSANAGLGSGAHEPVEVPVEPKGGLKAEGEIKWTGEPETTEFEGTGDITWTGEPEQTHFEGTGNVTWSGAPSTGPFYADGYITWHSSGGGGGGGCFVAGTQISMADGTTKNIEDIKVGDLVVAYDYKLKKFVPGKVNKAYIHHNTPRLIKITFSNNNYLILTPGHPLLSTKGWKSRDIENSLYEHKTEATLLEIGDEIIGLNNNLIVIDIQEMEVPKNYDTYNAEVEMYHTFIANGLVAHNAKAVVNDTGATGNFGLAHAKGTLMGELGPELVVSNGRYFVAGQNGAEMVDLADDAIVFNHLQTEQLLKKGMSNSRGKAVTSEKNAVAFATGNTGPAMASAGAAVAQLKRIRAMWESLLQASVSDLAGSGGGGGGGGGGGDNSKVVDPSIWVDTVERWYNLMQKIAKLEKEITHEETLRSKLQSDWNANGNHYYASQKRSLEALRDLIDAQEQLNLSREAYYDQRVEALQNLPFGKLIEFDNEGQMKFKSGAMEWLTDLAGFDSYGKANYTDEEKYNKLIAAGYGDYMKYDDGGEIKMDEDNDGEVTDEERQSFYSNATKAFWDKIDEYKEATQSLWDSIKEGEDAVLQLQADQNDLLAEIRDNQMEVEDAVLDAIVDIREREIDALQDERDKLEESTLKYIDGLTDALNNERQMYENQEAENSLNQLRRRLAILLRSGGSAQDIANLRSEIDSSERDMYFNLQQQQIDAILAASDLEIERMDSLIEIMTEALDYLKEYGLLWGNVYEVMEGTAQQITSFITNGNSEFWASSELATLKVINEQLFAAEQWTSYREDLSNAKASIGENGVTAKDIRDNVALMVTMNREQMKHNDYAIFDNAMRAEFGASYDSSGAYRDLFFSEYDKHGDLTKATATARAKYAADKAAAEAAQKATELAAAAAPASEGSGGGSGGGSGNNANKAKTWTATVYYSSSSGAVLSVSATSNISLEDAEKKAYAMVPANAQWASTNKNLASNLTPTTTKIPTTTLTTTVKTANQNTTRTKLESKGILPNTGTAGSAATAKTIEQSVKTFVNNSINTVGNFLKSLIPGKKASGGYVNHGIYELGEHGTETVLTASQTKVLRDNILSNRPNSLISLLKSYNEGYDGINNSVSGVTPVEDNSTVIEKVELNMEVKQIANDYDARRAGEQALNEMMRIARKTGAANSIRR